MNTFYPTRLERIKNIEHEYVKKGFLGFTWYVLKTSNTIGNDIYIYSGTIETDRIYLDDQLIYSKNPLK